VASIDPCSLLERTVDLQGKPEDPPSTDAMGSYQSVYKDEAIFALNPVHNRPLRSNSVRYPISIEYLNINRNDAIRRPEPADLKCLNKVGESGEKRREVWGEKREGGKRL